VLPAVLAALAARAFMPTGFMTTIEEPSGNRIVEAQLCSLDQERRDLIEIPGETHQGSRCDHCLSPLGVAPIALLDVPGPVDVGQWVRSLVSQVSQSIPRRTQLARAPPRA
jgi:hypothetical protein